jgi:cytoskeletal protein RodZ
MTPTLGQRLQQAREHRGLSLPDVAHKTRIPVHRLRELEEDNYNSLGSVAYAKGHIRSYAELLGVEADDVLEQMKTPPLGGVRNYRYLVESYGPLKAVRQSEHPQERATVVASSKSPIIAATVGALFVMVIGGVLLANAFLGEPQKETTPAPAAPAAVTAADASKTADGEFSLLGATLEVEPEVEVRTATPVVNPPKAIPVTDEAPATRRRISAVPKAQLVE